MKSILKTIGLFLLLTSSVNLFGQSNEKQKDSPQPSPKLQQETLKNLLLNKQQQQLSPSVIQPLQYPQNNNLIPQYIIPLETDQVQISRTGIIDSKGHKYHILIKQPDTRGLAKMPIKIVE